MNNFGLKFVFETVLSKGGMFVGKSYLCNGMFKLNVMPINKMNKNISFVYVLESTTTLWHNRLGHVNYRRIHDMIKLDLLPKCVQKENGKCRTSLLTK